MLVLVFQTGLVGFFVWFFLLISENVSIQPLVVNKFYWCKKRKISYILKLAPVLTLKGLPFIPVYFSV